MKRPLTDRDMETLGELEAANRSHAKLDNYLGGYARVMDCGGSNGSHHGATLNKLCQRGYAERRGNYAKGNRHRRRTNYYKITALGRTMLGHWQRRRKLA